MRGSIRTLPSDLRCEAVDAWERRQAAKGGVVKFLTAALAVAGFCVAPAGPAAAQDLPYKAIHHPQFVSAQQASFLHDGDRVIGVIVGSTATAYPAAILAQHGLVEDQSPNGPIAITW
jgi:hypothetical protein